MNLGVKDWWTPGKKLDQWERSASTQMTMCGPSSEEHKDKKFSHGAKQLWHTWDRPKEEVLLSKRVSLAIKALRTRAVREEYPDQRCRDGHRWRLGASPACGSQD